MVDRERYHKVIEEITKLYQQGYSTPEIGRLFNIHYTVIARYLRKNNVEMRYCGLGQNSLRVNTVNIGKVEGPKRKLSKIPNAETLADLLEYYATKELANKYNCAIGSIYNKLHAEDISIRRDIRVKIID